MSLRDLIDYIPYLIVFSGYMALFIKARGLFKKSAGYLLGTVPGLSGWSDEETVGLALRIFLLTSLLACAVTAAGRMGDTAAQGYLLRDEYGGDEETHHLSVSTADGSREIDLEVSPRELSAEEIRKILREASALVEEQLLAETGGYDSVDGDLTLTTGVEGYPVTVSWLTDRPDVLDWDGTNLCTNEEGEDVILTAHLACEDEYAEREFQLRVFPKTYSDSEREKLDILRSIEESNPASERTVNLPESVDGEEAHWRSRGDATGLIVLFMGALGALLYISAVNGRTQDKEKKREEEMERDYPGIVMKLVLLVSAGLSLRKAFYRIRSDYREELALEGKIRPGYEELSVMMEEMDRGVAEAEAYANLGKRCSSRMYRTFSALLVQNLMKGGNDLARILMTEADDAFEERKKKAKVLGEEAGTKLLLPMLLMLCVVMVILMIPAFLAFL